MNTQIIEVKIADIVVGERLRKDLGDIETLARSVEEVGLLQPIGITPDNHLVFGERRLRAYRDVLDRETIPACIVEIESIALGEFVENTMRKNFTPSELVAIVQTVRTFAHGGDRRSDQTRSCAVEGMTTEEAARKVGWSKDTFARAQKVVERGTSELRQAMDNREMSISAAAVLADADPEEQTACLARPLNVDRWEGRGIVKRLNRVRRAKEREAILKRDLAVPGNGDAVRLYHCRFQQLEEVAGVKPESAKLILTDIPYGGDFVPQVSDLAAVAERTLAPGGLFVAYVGQYRLNEKLRLLDEHLQFCWMGASVWHGEGNFTPHLKLVSKWIPIVIYSKGHWNPAIKWIDTFRVEAREKVWHEWQRPLDEVESLIHYFSQPGDLVLDPCGGGFTTAVACHRLGRRCISCDSEKEYVLKGQERLALERVPPQAA